MTLGSPYNLSLSVFSIKNQESGLRARRPLTTRHQLPLWYLFAFSLFIVVTKPFDTQDQERECFQFIPPVWVKVHLVSRVLNGTQRRIIEEDSVGIVWVKKVAARATSRMSDTSPSPPKAFARWPVFETITTAPPLRAQKYLPAKATV